MAKLSSSNGIEKFPKLRFPEFKEPWKQVKLSDFTERIVRKNKNNETDLPLTISSKDGLVDQISFFNKTVASKDISNYYLLRNGEFAYNKSYSVGYDFGSIKRLERYPMGALSTLYICFTLTKHNGDYIKTYFDSLKWYKEIYIISAEGARNHGLLNVPTDEFFDTYHYITDNPDEQQKIAAFMNLIDKRIQKQQQLLENIKKYKRGVIKTIFDTLTPVSKSSIGKMATMFSGGTPRSDIVEYYNGSIPFIRSGEIHNDFTELHLSQIGLDNSSAKMVRKGDLLYALYGATSGEVDISKIDGAINQAILCIRTNEISSEYLALWLEINKNNILSKMLQGGQGNLSGELVKSLVVPIYSKTEEQVIVRIGNSINKLIDANTNMLYMLNKAKESLLQQMFI